MISTDTVRKLVAVAEVAKDPYAVAAGAASLLAMGGPAAEGMAEFYIRALAVLRLHGPAMRLVKAPPTAGATGPIAWNSRARRFAANLKALEKTTPSAGLVAQAAGELSRFELYQAADGNYQILDTSQPVFAGWQGGLVDHKGAVSWNVGAGTTRIVQPIAFDGVGMGWPLMQFLDATANSFLNYSCAVYVLVCDPLALALALHMHDWQDLINGPRVRWFIAQTAEAAARDFKEALREHTTWSLPAQSVRCVLRNSPAIDIDNAVIAQRKERDARTGQLQASIARHYAGRDAAWWRQRFTEAQSGGPPLRVLGLTSRFTTVLQYSMQELHAAALAAGAAMEIAIEPDDQSLENPYLEMIAAQKPDLIVQLSRMRYENPSLPRGVPFLTWDQDNLPCMRTPEATASLDALTYVAGCGAVFGHTAMQWPLRNCIFCHAAAATIRYHSGAASAELLKKHACDVSFVSNASGTPEALAERLRARWQGSPFAAFFDDMIATVLANNAQGCERTWEFVALRNLARSSAAARGLPLEARVLNELTVDLNTFSDRAYRHTALAWVSAWCEKNGKRLRLYGNGWETHPTLAKWAAGSVAPGEEARAVFQASRINLQLMLPGFIHSRALDGLAAGGFFLARQTDADGVGSAEIATLYQLAKWVTNHGIMSDTQLDAVSDPKVRTMTAATRAYYLRHEVTEPLCPSLQVWAQAPAAGILFPQLGRIIFRNEAEFAALADRYLSDQKLRATLAMEMREIVEKQFSYRARFETFVAGVRNGLAAVTPDTAGRGG